MRYACVKYFDHIYSRVKAVPINKDSQLEVVDILMDDVANGLMAYMDVTTNPNGVYRVAFRYKKDTQDQILDPEEGHYLVIRGDGTKVSMAPKDFEEIYEEADVVDAMPLDPPIDTTPIDPDFSRPDELEEVEGMRPLAGTAKAGLAVLGFGQDENN